MSRIIYFFFITVILSDYTYAYDTFIEVKANVTNSTCTVDTKSKNITVELGNISTKDFISTIVEQQQTPMVPFSITLFDCQPENQSVKVNFIGDSPLSDNRLLALNPDSAKGVAIALMDESGAVIPINQSSQSYPLLPNQENTLQFYARYTAISLPVSAGKANATATFLLEYQ